LARNTLNQPGFQHSSLPARKDRQTFSACLWRNWRRCLLLFSFFCRIALPGHAAQTSLSDTNLIPENIPLWTESMLWDHQVTLSSGVGYNDNVLLSAFHPRGSQFSINGVDAMVLRLPLDGWQMEGAIIGDDIRYWRNVGTNSEDTFTASLRVQRELPRSWRAGFEVRGLYEKQVLDISTSVGVPTTALVDGYGYTLQPSLRKDFVPGFWLQLETPVTHLFYKAPLDEYWDYGPVVTAGYDYGERSDVTLSYGVSYQPHAQWAALDAEGRPLNRPLQIYQQRVELAWRQYWDAHHDWRSATRLIFTYRQDNGGGFFNDYQYQAVQDLRWQTANWQVKASAQLVAEIYPVQGVGILNGEILGRNLFDLSLEAERRLYKGLKVFAKWEYQQAQSNEAANAGDYLARTVSGGLRWEF